MERDRKAASKAVREAIEGLPSPPASADRIARFEAPPPGTAHTQVRIADPGLLGDALGAILAECRFALLEGGDGEREAALRRIAQLCMLLGYEEAPSDFFARARPPGAPRP